MTKYEVRMTNGPKRRSSFDTRHSSIGITVGDPAGIGPEIILKALERLPRLRPRIIGPREVFEREQTRLRTNVDLNLVDDSVEGPGRYEYGKPQALCGSTALLALEMGVYRLLKGHISALVTAPVSKEALRMAGFRWPGQTEFLAERLGSKRHAMLAWTPKFKAVFITIHEPLARVSRHISAAAVAEKADLLNRFLRDTGVKRPRICVMAFNPHGAEFSLGEEERIAAGIALARKAGISASGPVSADAAVARAVAPRPSPLAPRFDGFVAMYHDQAMIPAKLLGRDQGVNLALGLGRIRTSPLHGVAFDIAGQGIASPGSMLSAIRLAQRLCRFGSR
jgi:4-hydroxythreonine-4-phosphate dehydrogenase